MRIRWLTLALLALVAATALSASAGARGGPSPVTISKTKGGPLIDHAQVKHKAKTFWATVENATDHQLSITWDDRSAQRPHGDFNVRWFRGRHEVTHEMNHGGLEFNLGVGKQKTFRANVKPLVGNPGELCLAVGAFAEPDHVDRVGIVYINSTSICG
jgi:hypothetical protein